MTEHKSCGKKCPSMGFPHHQTHLGYKHKFSAQHRHRHTLMPATSIQQHCTAGFKQLQNWFDTNSSLVGTIMFRHDGWRVLCVCVSIQCLQTWNPWELLQLITASMSCCIYESLIPFVTKKRCICLFADGLHLTLASPCKHRNTLLIPVKNRHRETETKSRHGGWKKQCLLQCLQTTHFLINLAWSS